MDNVLKATPFDFRRSLACAALATLTTLGLFSLIANIMPPLMADGILLASDIQGICVPGPTLQAVAGKKHSAI